MVIININYYLKNLQTLLLINFSYNQMIAKSIFLFILIFVKSSTLDLKQIRREILANHNYHRAIHQAGKLTRDKEIEKIAQQYSKELAKRDVMEHSSNGYGENLYYCGSSSGICVTGVKASERWYEEIKDYDYNNPVFSGTTGHFTQLVWKGSQKIGCGAACNEKNKCYVTCNYSPAGNYEGRFASNVLEKIEITQSYDDFYEEAGKEFEDEDDEDAGMYLITNKILYIISFLILFI